MVDADWYGGQAAGDCDGVCQVVEVFACGVAGCTCGGGGGGGEVDGGGAGAGFALGTFIFFVSKRSILGGSSIVVAFVFCMTYVRKHERNQAI